MNCESFWQASKFVWIEGKLFANRDDSVVSVASRLNVDLLATALHRSISEYARGRLLDLGCGNVPLYDVYRSLVDNITCVDWSNSGHNLRHVDLAMDLNKALLLRSESFQTVILTDVLEHISEPEFLIGEIHRVLTPSGVLIGTVPFMYRLHEEPHDYFRYTEHALRHFANRNCLLVERLEAYGHGTDVFFDVIGKLLITMHWRFGPILASLCQKIGLWIRSTNLGRWLNRSAQTMPLGYVFVFRAMPQSVAPNDS